VLVPADRGLRGLNVIWQGGSSSLPGRGMIWGVSVGDVEVGR
jgi:hypothetical protein